MTRLVAALLVLSAWLPSAVLAEVDVPPPTEDAPADPPDAPLLVPIAAEPTVAPMLTLATCPEGLECHPDRGGVVHAFRRSETHRMQTDLIVVGSVMLGVAWAANIIGSALGSLLLALDSTARAGDYLGWSFVPLVGPIAQMFQLGDEHWQIPILAVVEAVEIIGLIIAAVGTAGEDVVTLEPVAGLSIVPWASSTGAGAVVSARF